ncbi:hypothetical protein NRIC_00410 [Enterococcus florum]|uniref:Uncharacterized protein n=1 Tax=Enterococcus florum TaxID=2480627 RepID=A0A4P5P3K7_9ENTE|nr:hypothetical protein [Enterococcus florum]GCF92150.1 hypothetical protein NRIC_00410 [Enterococcus florum]
MKKRVVIATLAVFFLAGGIAYGVHHNSEVQAREIAQKKQEEQVKKEADNLKSAENAVDQAYKTRNEKDIESANVSIDGLSDNQEAEKTRLAKKLSKLVDLLKQVSDLNIALDKATKSKAEEDIRAVQALLDKVTDSYLKSDKETIQNKLNSLIEEIKKEATEKEIAQADDFNVSTELAQPAEQAQSQQNNQPIYQEQQQNYQQPSYQQPTTPNYQPPAPVPNNPLPSGPAGGTPGNASGIQDSPGGNDSIGGIEWGH